MLNWILTVSTFEYYVYFNCNLLLKIIKTIYCSFIRFTKKFIMYICKEIYCAQSSSRTHFESRNIKCVEKTNISLIFIRLEKTFVNFHR